MSKPDFVPARCLSESRVTKVKVEANTRRAVFDNGDNAQVWIVDVDCWIPGPEGLKADYVVFQPQIVAIVVELKGSDIRHALQQVIATSTRWRDTSGTNATIGGLVIFTHSPETSASLANKKRKLRDKHNIHLEVDKNGRTEYRFETFTGKMV